MKELIHFAHGNGFPAPCYRQLLNHLEVHFNCCYIDKIGHNPQFPVTENWSFLVEEIITSVKQQASQPVIAVGHSFGGVLSLFAAIRQPHLFKTVIMLDSPLIGWFKSSVVQIAKSLNLIDRLTPAHRTRGRRQRWQSKEQVFDYLKSRELFKTFTDECLHDYIKYGLEQTVEGDYKLRFDRHIEYLIYRTIPHDLSPYKNKLVTPTALLYGDKSTVVDQFDIRYMKKKFAIANYKIHGTHMFPMESPFEVAEKITMIVNAIIK